MLPLDGALLFFDLAGTLVETDARLSPDRQATLQQLGRRAGRLFLVTGQPADDPQVQEILTLFTPEDTADFVAYTTRGGLRLQRQDGKFERDLAYLASSRLEESLCRAVEQEIAQVLAACQLQPRIPVQCIDEVAVRVNLSPNERPRFAAALAARLAEVGMTNLQVEIEGRTSIFTMLRGVGKRRAVQYELERARQEGINDPAFYFGNEVAEGNDREVLGLPGLEVCALGSCGSVPPGSRCRQIGETPSDLYAAIRASLDRERTVGRSLPVVCLSLGGTKLEVGALTHTGTFLCSPKLHWRESPAFAKCLDDQEAYRFCDALVHQVRAFLEYHGYDFSDVGVLGIPLPGPQADGRWYSNNLIRAFQQEGVALESEMVQALSRLPGKAIPPVRVAFDAQCDAGGELYHPDGRLSYPARGTTSSTATVLNVATGIAAGFIREGRVLVSNEDFRTYVAPDYDGGAGQLGRHLWYHPEQKQWKYHFCPQGQTPKVPAPAIRMTERLAGPALAARLLLILGHSGLLQPDSWTISDIPFSEIEELYQSLAHHNPELLPATAVQAVRRASHPVAGAILGWADEIYCRGEPTALASRIATFATQIATEFADALGAWMSSPGWMPFGRHIVLTGGVGIRFLASSDSIPSQNFCCTLESRLPDGCRVERSRLSKATERECYLFLHQLA
ncbi:MAG: hypothetical protein AB4426_31550 [Xenococcaceae cyanobacterium]